MLSFSNQNFKNFRKVMQVKLFDIFFHFFIFLKLKSANNSSRLVQLKLSDFAVKVKVVSKFGSPVMCANLEICNIIIDGI